MERILKTELFENDGFTIITWFPCPSFPQTQIQNDRWLLRFFNSSGVVWTENIWFVFTVKPPFSNSSSVVWTGPYKGVQLTKVCLVKTSCPPAANANKTTEFMVRADQHWEVYLCLLVHRGCKAVSPTRGVPLYSSALTRNVVLAKSRMRWSPHLSTVVHFSRYFSCSGHSFFPRCPLVDV